MPAATTSKREELEAGARTALLVRRTDLPVPRTHPARSFFGGLPKLPAAFDWPRAYVTSVDEPERVALTFMAQIDLAELPDFDARQYLPQTGTLYFFCSSVFEGEGTPPCRILFHPDRADQLPERPPPDDLMPLAGKDGEYQVKWLDSAADFYSKMEFKYPISFLPFLDFEFGEDPVGRDLLIRSLCEALGPGEPEYTDLLLHRRTDDYAKDGDWPFNWLLITHVVRSILSRLQRDLESSPYRRPSDETRETLLYIQASASGWLERAGRFPSLDSVDADAKSAFRAWWADAALKYETMYKTMKRQLFTYPHQIIGDLGEVINHTIRYMAAQGERTLDYAPRSYVENLKRQNHWKTLSVDQSESRFFSTPIHQIQGYGSSWQDAPFEHCEDVLLLQIQGDQAFFDWHTNRGCVLHFWIGRDALAELDFSEVEATLECD
jgi:uncharacterized protein YwqG